MPLNNPLGYSFEPGTKSVGMHKPAQPSLAPPSAVEYRNLRIPNRQVPGQISPQALLQAPGGQGMPDVQLLQQLMQAFAPQGSQPGVPMLASPQAQGGMQAPMAPAPPPMGGAPRIIPGDDTPPTVGDGQRTGGLDTRTVAPQPGISFSDEELQRMIADTLAQVPTGPFGTSGPFTF